MCSNGLHDPHQSAYRKFHSTETAMLKVHCDITSALDRGEGAALLMLDLSAAFDTIDHGILLTRLEKSYGIQGVAHKWIKSYLTGRTQSVVIDGNNSTPRELDFSVPQGSVLGPRKYCMYCRVIGLIASHFGLQYHCYADDSQLYIVFRSLEGWTKAVKPIEDCVTDIYGWMELNLLKMNEEKTEFIVFSPWSSPISVETISLQVGKSVIRPDKVVKNLGTHWDLHLQMEKQVNSVCKSCYYQLRILGKIRHYLSVDTCRTLVQAFVVSRLDYGNACLSGITEELMLKLEHVQNDAARLISGKGKYDHISATLYEYHWLPVPKRIDFKILMYVFKCVNSFAPEYLSNLLIMYTPPREGLRPRCAKTLVAPIPRTRYGERTFTYKAAVLWNGLPDGLRSLSTVTQFKRGLKTHLFKQAFD